ncbi:MAG TPA: hypothetical protein VHO72_09050 [Bacteroidales bacterium]|nr:hypothetical protein [Bacteroidales bacterium]
MSLHGIYQLAADYNVKIIDAKDIFSSVEGLVRALNPQQQLELLKRYGDAGRPSTYLYVSKDKNPSPFDTYKKANDLLFIKNESLLWESYPYFYDVKIDDLDNSLRIRFHYFYGTSMTVDENNKQHELRYKHYGVAIYRKDSRVLEVRTKHKTMADKIARNTPVQLGIAPFESISLMDDKLKKAFVGWIQFLNSANIELPSTEEVAGSLHMTARKGMDLKTAAKFTRELRDGQLQGGHVTIGHGETKVNFRINFRDCHVSYTLFTVEQDIAYVINAVEKIMEGYKFDKTRPLKDFFDK